MTIHINKTPVTLQIDTASDITIISDGTWKAIGGKQLSETKHEARNAIGQTIEFLGQFYCELEFRNATGKGTCYVVHSDNLNLLGIDWIEQLGLWNIPLNSVCDQTFGSPYVNSFSLNTEPNILNVLKVKYEEVFSGGLGKCTQAKANLYLQPGYKPVFRPKRPVPYALVTEIEEELDGLEQNEVLSKVKYLAWAAPIVAVKKANSNVRICGVFPPD